MIYSTTQLLDKQKLRYIYLVAFRLDDLVLL